MSENLKHGHGAKVLNDAEKKFLATIGQLELHPIKLDGAVDELTKVTTKLINHIGKAKKDLENGELTDDQFQLVVGTIRVCVNTVDVHKINIQDARERVTGQIAGLKKAVSIVSDMRDFELAAKARIEDIEKEAEAALVEGVSGSEGRFGLSEADTRFGGKMAQAAKRFNRNKQEKPPKEEVVVDEGATERFKATYTQKQLQEMAREMGVSSSGSKGDIVERILLSGKDIPKNGAALPAG